MNQLDVNITFITDGLKRIVKEKKQFKKKKPRRLRDTANTYFHVSSFAFDCICETKPSVIVSDCSQNPKRKKNGYDMVVDEWCLHYKF